MPKKKVRTLIVIGGREDKVGDKLILSEVARRIGRGRLVIAAVASKYPGPLFDEYDHVFRSLGLKHVAKLEIHNRCEANDETKIRVLDDAAGVFFTGGDQLRITSQLGDTPVHRRIKDIYESQGLIAGTSAGASVMCETMIVSSGNPHSHKVSDSIKLAPGFGLIGGMIIDQHFSERSRMVRLLGSIAQNPKNLGLGIDEQTAIIIEGDRTFYVLGSGAVYVIDGGGISFSNIAEEEINTTVSMYDVRLHVLSQGDKFDLPNRRPEKLSVRAAAELPEVKDIEYKHY
ncbi:MAG TPA: cyanophycinase [Blastocatellia bacterium]|nr:cyanophycinase [Blastocatellia bacterium]